jgi:release factor glutamine methyltransferase
VTLGEVLRRATEYLAGKGVDSPRLDAEHLLGKALGLSRVELYMHHDRPVSEPERDAYRELVRRRGAREPLAYVLGEWDFRHLTLKSDHRALVPRPETEIVVDRALALIRDVPQPHVLDVGTGTGAIALSIAQEHPGACLIALDVSGDALSLAQENAERTRLADRVRFIEGDLHDGFDADAYHLVVSNPPYVSEDEFPHVPPEVREWEPRLATVGATHTRAVAEGAREALRENGHVVLEVADARAEEAAALLEELGYEDVRLSPDLTGRDRIAEGRWPA